MMMEERKHEKIEQERQKQRAASSQK